ncbi:MAG: sigma-70 family RNA polymerase sigma factor [Acidimicrobiales bacterium]
MAAALSELRSKEWLATVFDRDVDAAFHVAAWIVWNTADAQDVVQTAFVRAARNVDQLRDPGKVRAWLLRITYHEALAVLRRRARPHRSRRPRAGDLRDPGPEELVMAGERARIVRDAIQALPVRLRVAFVLRDVEELPMADVAAVLDIGESAAKMRVSRARESLRVALAGEVRHDL